MKLLVITHEFPPVGGGGANACYFLTGEFVRSGEDVTVITSAYEDLPLQESVNGAAIYRVPSGRKHREYSTFREMFTFLIHAQKLAVSLQRENAYDLCLAFFGIPSGPVAYYLKRRFDLPYVIRFGGGDVPGFQERYRHVYRILGLAIRRIWKHAGARIVNSRGLQDLASAYYDKEPFTIITNGVDTELFCPAGTAASDPAGCSGSESVTSVLRILFVSRLIPRKGLQIILQDWDRICEMSSRKLELLIAGDGPYRRELEQIAAKQRYSDCIHFLGQKERRDLPAIYRSADLFVLPSEKEGMPNVVLEAMASGLPILMTPCQGSDELIDGNGQIAGQTQFTDTLIHMIAQEEALHDMGRISRSRAIEHFSWQHTAEQYRQLMHALCAENNRT